MMVLKIKWLPAEIEAWFFANNIAIKDDFQQADGNICIETDNGLYRYDMHTGELLKHLSMVTRPHWFVANSEKNKQLDLFKERTSGRKT